MAGSTRFVANNSIPITYGSNSAGVSVGLKWNPSFPGKESALFNRAQEYVDSEVLRLSSPYIPHRSGTLEKSGPLNTIIGSGVVEQKTPYARKMWVGTNYNFTGAPKRGSYWALRMLKEGGQDKIVAGVKQILKG